MDPREEWGGLFGVLAKNPKTPPLKLHPENVPGTLFNLEPPPPTAFLTVSQNPPGKYCLDRGGAPPDPRKPPKRPFWGFQGSRGSKTGFGGCFGGFQGSRGVWGGFWPKPPPDPSKTPPCPDFLPQGLVWTYPGSCGSWV